MSVQPSAGINILQQAYKDPAVVSAQQQVETWKHQLDKVELSLNSGRPQIFQLEPSLYEQCWNVRASNLSHAAVPVLLLGVAGTMMGISMAASALPALQPFRGLLMIGGLIASFKYIPRGLGYAVRTWLLPPRVEKDIKRHLAVEKQRAESNLHYAETRRDQVVKSVTEQLFARAEKDAEEKAATQPQGAGEVRKEDEYVVVNGIRVQKKAAAG